MRHRSYDSEIVAGVVETYSRNRTRLPSPTFSLYDFDMTMLEFAIDDDLASRIDEVARREGISTTKLMMRALEAYVEPDPFGFIEVGSSDVLRGESADNLLADGFGH